MRPERGAFAGWNNTAVRAAGGLIRASMLSHLLAIGGSKSVKPVMLPPGREILATKPWPTGSVTLTHTIGIVLGCRCIAATHGGPFANRKSGPSATSSVA